MKLLRPDYIATALQDINAELLAKNGIRGMICDLDNTIIPWDSPSMEPEITQWIGNLRRHGYRICLLSNNMPQRVKTIAGSLEVPYVPRACKPAKSGFRQALAILQLPPEEVAVVGDQLFTDILGGNRLGMYTIWVAPLTAKEFIGTKVTRQIEKITVRLLRLK